MVSTSIPLLRAGGQCRKVILTPTGRYKYNPCCSITCHVSNSRERNYVRWMEEKLTELKGTVRDYVRMRNIKRATVIEMGQLLTPTASQSGYLHEEEVWGEDPVHLTSKGYSMAAAGLESLIYEKRGEEKDAEEKGVQGPAKRPRYDAAEAVEGSPGRPSNNRQAGEAASSREAPEEPATEAAAAEAAAAADPDTDLERAPAGAEATAGGGGTEPLGGITRAEGGPGELPAQPVV